MLGLRSVDRVRAVSELEVGDIIAWEGEACAVWEILGEQAEKGEVSRKLALVIMGGTNHRVTRQETLSATLEVHLLWDALADAYAHEPAPDTEPAPAEAKWFHAPSIDEEVWTGPFASRESAVRDAEDVYPPDDDGVIAFAAAPGHKSDPAQFMVSLHDLVEQVAERAWDEIGMAADDYPDLLPTDELALQRELDRIARRFFPTNMYAVDKARASEITLQTGEGEDAPAT